MASPKEAKKFALCSECRSVCTSSQIHLDSLSCNTYIVYRGKREPNPGQSVLEPCNTTVVFFLLASHGEMYTEAAVRN